MPEILIRPATALDAPALGRLGALLVRAHYDFDPRRFLAPTPRTERGYGSFLAGEIADPDVVMLVAEREGEVVGYTYASIEGNDWMTLRGPAGLLHDIVVDAGARTGGVGRMLLDATMAALRERGAPRVVLNTAWTNTTAQRLFEKAGFRRTMVEMTCELEPELPG